ncbi:UPF0598 protein CG30010 isoform X2 [Daktulosphaira vitifoliae]|uniref:UPF0598 protein CG30010 isoform X2 n=1 Tax=Daktulosphaira vitifoliae TaxID=58002 RepID=UPI0021A98355|nr:UPF0598 protein CG30010 isoform X2 [Daktulosphaira vitifoliae]
MISILSKLNYIQNGFLWVQSKNYCHTIKYVQGQSPEKNIREYFYFIDHQGMLFLDDSKMKNFTSAYKEIDFLVFFFKRLKKNTTNRFTEQFPWISLCGRERNYIRCDDLPIVFTHIIKNEVGFFFSHNHAGQKLIIPFEPRKIWMDVENGRVYHPASEQFGSIGLVSSKAAIDLSKRFVYADEDLLIPTQFMWDGKKHILDSEWIKNVKTE